MDIIFSNHIIQFKSIKLVLTVGVGGGRVSQIQIHQTVPYFNKCTKLQNAVFPKLTIIAYQQYSEFIPGTYRRGRYSWPAYKQINTGSKEQT